MRKSHTMRLAGLAVTGLAVFTSATSMAAQPWPDYELKAHKTAIAACTLLTDVDQVGDNIIAVGDRGIIVKASLSELESSVKAFDPTAKANCGFPEDRDVQTDAATGEDSIDADGNPIYVNAETPSAFDPNCICHTVHRWEQGEDDPGYFRYNNPEWRVWKQSENVPTRVLLTAVSFVDDKTGWAVGHDAVILKTTDGGNTWNTQHAKAGGMVFPSSKDDPEGDKSPMALLDVKFFNKNRGMVIGAFGLVMTTNDGGKTWDRQFLGEDQDFEFHLNKIAVLNDGSYAIIAEYGQVLHSEDAGRTWTITETGYEGSFFGGIPMGQYGLVVYGLRGNAYINNDVRNTDGWTKLDTGVSSTLLGGVPTGVNSGIAVGAKGTTLNFTQGGANVAPMNNPNEDPLAALIAIDGGFVAVGAKGVQFLPAAQ